jgi:hypothetical protein
VNDRTFPAARDLARLVHEAQTIAAANTALSGYHRGRRQALATT